MEMRPFVTLRKKKERKSRRRLLVIRVRLIIRQRRPVIYFRGFVKHGGLLLSSKWELFGVFLFSGQFIFSISSQFFQTKKKEFLDEIIGASSHEVPFHAVENHETATEFLSISNYDVVSSMRFPSRPTATSSSSSIFKHSLYSLPFHVRFVDKNRWRTGCDSCGFQAANPLPPNAEISQHAHTHGENTHRHTKEKKKKKKTKKNERECPIWFRSSPLRPISPSYFLSYRLRRRRRRRKKK